MTRTFAIFIASLLAGVAAAQPTELRPRDGQADPAAVPVGTLTIKTTNGTPGGSVPVGADVYVDFMHHGTVVDKASAKLDITGSATFTNIKLTKPIQPTATVIYAGAEYRTVAKIPLSVQTRTGELYVKVYEPTEQEPQWKIRMRHLIVRNTAEGLQVSEMLAINNPADRAWLGRKLDGDKRQVLALPLPSNAQDVELVSGFSECCTSIQNGMITTAVAMQPGDTRYQISYLIPMNEGKAQIAVAAPAGVEHFLAMVPDDGSKVETSGLESAGSSDRGEQGKVRMFMAKHQTPGQIASISLTNVKSVKDTAAAAASLKQLQGFSTIAQMIAGGGGVLVLLGIVVVFIIPRGKSR